MDATRVARFGHSAGAFLVAAGHAGYLRVTRGSPARIAENEQFVEALHTAGVDRADLMEVAPPYDPAHVTALVGATLAFDMLSLLVLGASDADESPGSERGAEVPVDPRSAP